MSQKINISLENRASSGLRCYTDEFRMQDGSRMVLEIAKHHSRGQIYVEEYHTEYSSEKGKTTTGEIIEYFKTFKQAISFIEEKYNLKTTLNPNNEQWTKKTWDQQIQYAETGKY